MTFLHGVEIQEVDKGPRPIGGVNASVIGLVGTATFGNAPQDVPVLISGSRKTAEDRFGKVRTDEEVSEGNTLPYALNAILDQTAAQIVVVKVANSDSIKAGVQALVGAESVVHQTPRILIAPGFSDESVVVSALNSAAERLRGVAVVDVVTPGSAGTAGSSSDGTGKQADQSPQGNDNDAIADVISNVPEVDSSRLYAVYPFVKVSLGGVRFRLEPASARVAGVIAKSDDERGFWWSPSNRPIAGIVGTKQPIDFSLGDSLSSANQLNEGKIASIIHQGGYRLWGNRSLSTDPKWAFISVRRTADLINDALQRAHLWAVDRNITKTYVNEVTEGVNAYLRHLKSQGAIINGTCWADPEVNTWDQIQQGKVTFDFDFTPPYPAEHITFRSTLVNDYLEEIFA